MSAFEPAIEHLKILCIIVLFGGSIHEDRLKHYEKSLRELTDAGFLNTKWRGGSFGNVTRYSINAHGKEFVKIFGNNTLNDALEVLK
jgi:hypothetical protein